MKTGTVVNLCDDCYEHVTGLLAECQDYCSISLSHTGLCDDIAARPSMPCGRCGDTGSRLTEHEIQDDEEVSRMGRGNT